MNAPPSSGPAVVGVGIDLAAVERLTKAMHRREGLASRLFTASEREMLVGADSVSVAQRFAAKEAVMKALGVGIDSVSFTDIELDTGLDGVLLSGPARRRAEQIGAAQFEVRVGVVDGPEGKVATAEVIASSTVT